MKEFFGFGGYSRPAEGYLSWQHLLFVSTLVCFMVFLAIILGQRSKSRPYSQKNRVLIGAAICIDAVELFKIIMICIRESNPMHWLYELPLFLCSVQLVTMPLAAFSKGRFREASLDFICIFGVLGAVLGTYGAGQNYGSYPVLSLDNVASGITHTLSGFAALYIMISGMTSMKKKNIFITFAILIGFCIAAYIANLALGSNYMFLMRGDGTPYDIFFNLVGGNPVLYPLLVVVLFLVYIVIFYTVYFLLQKKVPATTK